MKNPHGRYILILAIIFGVEWIALAIYPYDRADWVLENVLAVLFIAVITRRWYWNGGRKNSSTNRIYINCRRCELLKFRSGILTFYD